MKRKIIGITIIAIATLIYFWLVPQVYPQPWKPGPRCKQSDCIYGYVAYKDKDNKTVRQTGVNVNLYKVKCSGKVFFGSKVTDEEGYFEFYNLVDSVYFVEGEVGDKKILSDNSTQIIGKPWK